MESILNDKRFMHIVKDPKFRRISKNEHKIKIDKRFQSMFKDKQFSVKYTIDKRGRPVNQTSIENLKKYYDCSSSEEDSLYKESEFSGQKNEFKNKKKKMKTKNNFQRNKIDVIKENKIKENNYTLGEKLDKKLETLRKKDLKFKTKGEIISHDQMNKKIQNFNIDYARGEEILLCTSSSSEESSDCEDEKLMNNNWGELDKEIETTEIMTNRLAVCNMDWDRIRALDLMVLFNSFLPSGGVIDSVTIYPSEFGLQRIKDEEVNGPLELINEKNKNSSENFSESSDNENEEQYSYHMERVREYQLNRLKYYYAIIVFDSPDTANKIYTECDGLEYESSSTKLDLRFIPNDMIFDQEPKEFCNILPDLIKYKPRQFTTTALQQVKVDLTWDETNPERKEINQKLKCGKFDDIHKSDIHTYLATESSEDENEDKIKKELEGINSLNMIDNPIDKYKSLLKSIEQSEEKKNNEVDLEFTWGLNIKKNAEKLIKQNVKKNENITPFEKYLEKRKIKKKYKREEKRKNSCKDDVNDSESEDSIHSNIKNNNIYCSQRLKSIKSKSQRRNTSLNIDFDVNNTKAEKAKNSELELLLMDEYKSNNDHFNMKKIEEAQNLIKSKKKYLSGKKKDLKEEAIKDKFEINVNDPRFNALFTSHNYNIDPADSHYRKTKGTEALIQEKLNRRIKNDIDTKINQEFTNEENNYSNLKVNAELNTLINSIKRNAQKFRK